MPTESIPEMPTGGSAAGSGFLYEPPGKALSISIEYDIVDRLGFDIMRGFGAVPRRGAEVGGILLGSAEQGDRLIVKIEDYVLTPCEHLRGPSYILSEADLAKFDLALAEWAPGPDKRIHAIGFFRSNTRDALQLGQEDLNLIESRFPGPTAVCLLIRPYATRVSEAAYLWRSGGTFPVDPVTEIFPFRRKELGGGPRNRRRPDGGGHDEVHYDTGYGAGHEQSGAHAGLGSTLASAIVDAAVPAMGEEGWTPPEPRAEGQSVPVPSAPATEDAKPRPGWVWIPLSFIFLLLGVVLGFQIAMNFAKPAQAPKAADPYAMELTVARSGDSLHLKWSLAAPAIRQAQRAVLTIQDGDTSKLVDLTPEDLARGGVLYRNFAPQVRFRLEVYPRDRNSVTETAETKLIEGR